MIKSTSGSVWLSILLLGLTSSRLCAQSTPVTLSDSIRAEFVRNAKRINADLIKGDFALQREEGYKATIASQSKANGALTIALEACNQTGETKTKRLREAEEQLGTETNKRRAARLENWAWRALVILTIYAKIKGL